jgi:hypothetical protein
MAVEGSFPHDEIQARERRRMMQSTKTVIGHRYRLHKNNQVLLMMQSA